MANTGNEEVNSKINNSNKWKHEKENIQQDLEQSGLSAYLLCLQEALKIITKSNAKSMGELQNFINTQKVSPAVKSVLKQEIGLVENASPRMQNVDKMQQLQNNLQEGIQDIKYLSTIQNSIAKDNSLKPSKENRNEVHRKKENLLNQLTSFKDIVIDKNDVRDRENSDLSQLKTISKLVRLFVEEQTIKASVKGEEKNNQSHIEHNSALESVQSNVEHGSNRKILEHSKPKHSKKEKEEINTQNNNIESIIDGEQEVRSMDASDTEELKRKKASEYNLNVSYDLFKDGDLPQFRKAREDGEEVDDINTPYADIMKDVEQNIAYGIIAGLTEATNISMHISDPQVSALEPNISNKTETSMER